MSASGGGSGAGPTSGLSVVVPLHNGREYIVETLDSLQRQTLPLDSVVVVDDGSTDDGGAIARAHPLRPTVVSQSQAGVAVARNLGALHVRSRHLAFLDQDDLWLPHRHARLRRFLDAHPDCAGLVTSERSFYLASDQAELAARDERLHRGADFPAVGSTVELLQMGEADDGSVPLVTRSITTRELLSGSVSVTTSYVFERETFLSVGGCATFARSLDDYWALLNLSRLVDLLAVDEPSVLYRIHPASTTMSTSWAMPLLTSLAAARFGGNLVALEDARDVRSVTSLDDDRGFWRQHLATLARSGDAGSYLDAIALTQLLACSPRERRRLIAVLSRSAVKARLRGLARRR